MVVEQTDPEGSERGDRGGGAHIGAAHFEELLQSHFREQGREVILPILDRRLFARQLRQFPLEEFAEAFAGDVHIFAVPDGEIHRHVERVVDIALKAHAVFEGEGQHAGAGIVGIEPDMRAKAQIAAVLAVDKRRVGKQRRGDRLQRQAHPQLFDHVGFTGEIQVGLHRRRAVHHRGPERADLVHIRRHDAVATLWHGRNIANRP